MKTYRFACAEHGLFERALSIRDPGTRAQPCPVCGASCGQRYERPAVIFAGDGFHCNDYPGRKSTV